MEKINYMFGFEAKKNSFGRVRVASNYELKTPLMYSSVLLFYARISSTSASRKPPPLWTYCTWAAVLNASKHWR